MLTENTQRPKTAMTGAAAARFPLPSRAFLMARVHSPFFSSTGTACPYAASHGFTGAPT